MGEDAGGAQRETGQNPRSINEAALLEALDSLGTEISGANPRTLATLIEESVRAYPAALHPSHEDFVPTGLREDFDGVEQACREAFTRLVKAARDLKSSIDGAATSDDLLASYRGGGQEAEISPFESAVMALTRMSVQDASSGTLDEITRAVILLSNLEIAIERKRRGRKPVSDLDAAIVRACYFHRHEWGLGLELDWKYHERTPDRHSRRTRNGELEPKTPMAKLACAVVGVVIGQTDVARVKTILDKYVAELSGRPPRRSDFIDEFY